jgi:UDP-N-acetylmuramoyl-L-alanyl-D-glutamate--2,6-diaminopimelate ligase
VISWQALVHFARAFYGDPSREMTVVGITGTNGKTTTSWMVKSVLSQVSAPPLHTGCEKTDGRG